MPKPGQAQSSPVKPSATLNCLVLHHLSSQFIMATPSFRSSSKSSPPPIPQLKASPAANESPSNSIPRSRSVQFSTLDAPMSRSISPRSHAHQRHQEESSADEITPIVNRERGGMKNKKYDSTSTGQLAESGEPGTSRPRSSSSARGRNAGQSGSGSKCRDTTAKDGKVGRAWWREVAEKYGTVELENKGSVARDHLALGVSKLPLLFACLSRCSRPGFESPSSCPDAISRLMLARTHLLGLASYFPRLRFYRHRRDPAFSA